ncbi:MAG: hypothetical protein P3W91_003235, partial [Fervidobacterium sp.]|nr:hypothetical protein [Fervidobacterium sp.]
IYMDRTLSQSYYSRFRAYLPMLYGDMTVVVISMWAHFIILSLQNSPRNGASFLDLWVGLIVFVHQRHCKPAKHGGLFSFADLFAVLMLQFQS